MHKILIVEDDKVIAEQIAKQLTSWGCTARCVSDFNGVMGEFAEFEPDLVLLDISLPFFNGYHWCTQIRAVSKVPVMFISSTADNMNIVMAMAWQQSDNGRKLVNSGGVCSATDGDIDIAYGLLLADRQWGSSGDIDYKGAALKIIGDIYKYEINHKTYTVQYGDWVKWSSKQSREYTGTRSSDFITAEFRAFAAASGNNGWNKVTARCYSLMSRVNKVYSGRTGLMPDFMYMKKNGKYRPELKYKRESALDGGYGYNACRDPWRIGTDYLVSGSSRARYQTSLLNRWIRKKTGGDPSKIRAGYTLKGKIRAGYSDMCFTAPFLVAAVCDTSGTAGAQKWVDSLWNEIVSAGTTNYYNDTIKLLTMMFNSSASENKISMLAADYQNSIRMAGRSYRYATVTSRAGYENEYAGLTGGFLFLGIFLGIVFTFAAALIIYYKQISEGYYDKDKFEIMQKVGMSRSEVKRSIRSQVLMVFYIPLIVAGCHMMGAFNMIRQMLRLFSLSNVGLFLQCTAVTFVVFAAIYALVYYVTAREYYKIVQYE